MRGIVKENLKKSFELKTEWIPIIYFLFSIILLILGNYLSQRAQIYLRETFDPVWVFIVKGYVGPILYIFGGFMFISGLNKLFFLYPFVCNNSKKQKLVSKTLLIVMISFLAVCFLNVLPYTIQYSISSFFHMDFDLLSVCPWLSFLFDKSGNLFVLGQTGGRLFESLHQERSFIFIFLGIVLWYLRPYSSKEKR